MSATVSEPERAASAGRIRVLLALLYACFAVHCAVFVPRLSNNHLGDVEFTGWSGPLGSRLVQGQRPWVDFHVPIPPGSFALLGLIEKLAGAPRLLHELWLNATLHAGMAALAYLIGVRITTRLNAILMALLSLVAVVQLNKECAYDHTAQAVAWAALAVGLWACLTDDARKRRRAWLAAGLMSGLVVAFKQSTGLGAVAGWLAALGYLALVELRSGHRGEARARLRDIAAFAAGGLVGVALDLGLVLALGGSVAGCLQTVFVDGPALKGGAPRLVGHVFGYLVTWPAYPGSLAVVLVAALIGARLLRLEQRLHLGDEPARPREIDARATRLVATAIVVTFAGTVALMLSPWRDIDDQVVRAIDLLKGVPSFGLLCAIGMGLGHLVKTGPRDAAQPLSQDRERVGHVLNALFLAALGTSLLHNTSAPEFRVFYDNNPLVPVAFFFLLATLDRVRLPWLKALVVVLSLGSLYGNKLDRAMAARVSVGKSGHWAGLRVSEHGRTVVQAALRVRQIAGPADTVLVAPEDLQIEALIGRPRPPLQGAIVFVDQYPRRLARGDIALLGRDPPKVVVVHPRDPRQWVQLFRIWSGDSGAEQVLRYIRDDLLPRHYVLDSTYETTFLWEKAQLDVWVRKD